MKAFRIDMLSHRCGDQWLKKLHLKVSRDIHLTMKAIAYPNTKPYECIKYHEIKIGDKDCSTSPQKHLALICSPTGNIMSLHQFWVSRMFMSSLNLPLHILLALLSISWWFTWNDKHFVLISTSAIHVVYFNSISLTLLDPDKADGFTPTSITTHACERFNQPVL